MRAYKIATLLGAVWACQTFNTTAICVSGDQINGCNYDLCEGQMCKGDYVTSDYGVTAYADD